MKRFLTVLFTALVLTGVLCVTASASTFDGAAEDLTAIGIFQGTASGFDLDRAPTRSEAAIMLVRLYGAENAAKAAYEAGTISHPFTDVSAFASPYVAWLYSSGITNGVSAAEFGSARPCSAQNYTVFLLRVLGYQDGQDFQYADAAAFAAGKGLLNLSSLLGGTFLRDDLAGMTYQALACEVKDSGTYLLDSLVKSGAVDAAAAKPITDKIENYRALQSAAGQENSMDVELFMQAEVQADMTGSVSGESVHEREEMRMTGSGSLQVILDGGRLELGMQLSAKAQEETVRLGVWLRDGWLYADVNGVRLKMDAHEELEEIMALYQEMLNAFNPSAGAAMMLPLIDSISVKTSGRDTVYTLTLNRVLTGLMDRLLELAMAEIEEDGAEMTLDLSKCEYVYTLGSDGKLKEVSAAVDMDMNMDMAENAGQVSMHMGMEMALNMKVKALGKSVKVSYPAGLDRYPSLMGGADGPTGLWGTAA